MRKFSLSKEELSTLYLEQYMPANAIATKLGLGKTTIYRWLERYNIPIRKSIVETKSKGLYQGFCLECGKNTSMSESKITCKSCLDKEYYQNNKEKIKIVVKEYRGSHKEYYKLNNQQWVRNNKELSNDYKRINKAKRRLKVKEGNFGIREWRNILAKQQGICLYCDKETILTIEHIIPLARGGTHTIDNICGVCMSCNISKNDKLLSEWNPALIQKVGDFFG